MSYIKNTWAKGDVVTAEKLNNIETGVFDALPLVIHEDEQDGTLDVKANAITAKLNAGHSCVIVRNLDDGVVQDNILGMRLIESEFNYETVSGVTYISSTAEGYPHRLTIG